METRIERAFKRNDRINHRKYGKGTFVGYVGYGDKPKLIRIQFDNDSVHDFTYDKLMTNLKWMKDEHIMETFKIVTVSQNTNSFGLYGVIIMNQKGNAFEIGMSGYNEPKKGQGLIVELDADRNISSIRNKSFEIPRKLADAPPEVVREVWAN
jgi:hypothetical protein